MRGTTCLTTTATPKVRAVEYALNTLLKEGLVFPYFINSITVESGSMLFHSEFLTVLVGPCCCGLADYLPQQTLFCVLAKVYRICKIIKWV